MSTPNMEDFDALVADLIKADTPQEDTPKEDGFKLHLGGRDYKFNTQEEAERAVETHMARLEEQARAATAANNTPPPAPAVPVVKEGEVDPRVKDFVSSLEKGDFKTLANIILKHGVFDGKIDDPSAVLTESLLRTAQLDRQTAVSQFLAQHPELATDNAAASAVEQARQMLNLPATPQGFEAAHAYAERIGQIKSGQQPNNMSQPTQRNAPPALPSARSSNTGSGQPQTDADWEAFYNSRSDEELDKLMKAAYAQRG